MEILVTNVIDLMKWRKQEQATRWLYIRLLYFCLPSLHLLIGFAVRSLLPMSRCQLVSTEEARSRECGCAWHQLGTLHKYMVRPGLEDNWHVLKSSSSFTHHRAVLLWTCAQSNKIRHKVAWMPWLKYLPTCGPDVWSKHFR